MNVATPAILHRPPRSIRARAFLLIAVTACGALAEHALAQDESLLVVVDPGVRTAARLALRPVPEVRFVVTAVAGPTAPAARAGVELRRIVAGPVALHGALAELTSPTGAGPTSDRWGAPSRLALDGGLTPGSRAGIGLVVHRSTGVYAWHAGNTASVAGSLRLAPAVPSRPFADLLVSGSWPLVTDRVGFPGIVVSVREGDDRDDPLQASWFADGVEPTRSAHVLARAGFDAGRAAASAALLASLPDALMPGVGVRASVRVLAFRRLEVSALAALSSPDARGIDGRRLDPPARLSGATRARFGALSLTATVERTFISAEAAYASVGLAPERLVVADTGYRLRLAWSGRDADRPAAAVTGVALGRRPLSLRTLSLDGTLTSAPAEPLDWRLTAGAGLRLFDGIVDLEPSARLDASDELRVRVRVVTASSARLAAAVTLESTRPLQTPVDDGGAAVVKVQVQVKMSVEASGNDGGRADQEPTATIPE
jgi:hypothetical protein